MLALLLSSTVALANPFLACDPQERVKAYSITGPEWLARVIPAEANGSLKLDLGSSPVGVHKATIKACEEITCTCGIATTCIAADGVTVVACCTSDGTVNGTPVTCCSPEKSFTLYKTYSIGATGGTKTPTLRFEWWVTDEGLKVVE